MKIRIRYKVRNESEKHVDLTPKEYFDPLYSDDENYEHNCVARFDFAEEYLEISTKNLEWTEIEITETKIGRITRKQYSADGHSWMCHIKNSDGYEEIIMHSRLNDVTTHISRIHKENEIWKVNYNGIFTERADDSEKEKRIF